MKRFFIAKQEAPAYINEQLEIQSVEIEELLQITIPQGIISKNKPITFFISNPDYKLLEKPVVEYKANHNKQTQTDESSFTNNQ